VPASVGSTLIAAASALSILLFAAAQAGPADAGVDEAGDAADGSSTPDESAEQRRDGGWDQGDAERAADTSPVVPLRLLVKAQGTRDTVPGASLVVDGQVLAESDPDGIMSASLAPGHHRLRIQCPGFESEALVIDLPLADRLEVRLRPAESGERYQTVVTSRPAGHSVPLAGEEAASLPGAAADPFRSLESMPGVANVFWPLPLYAVRGSNPGNTGFLLDGIKVPSLFHLALGPSVIHPLLLDRMSFYPGSYPVQYGRYAGGLVTATTSAPPVDRLRAVVDVRALDSGALVTAPWSDGRGSVAVAGRYSYTGFLISRLSSDYQFGYWDYQLRADHSLGPGRVILLVFGAADQLHRKDQPGTDANLSFHRARLAWDGGLAGGRLLAGIALGTDHTFVNLQDIMISPMTVRSYLLAPRLEYVRPVARTLDVQAGMDADIQKFLPESELASVDRPDISRPRTAFAWGAFLGVRWQPSADWLLSPGLRVDRFAEEGIGETALQPRLEVAWRARRSLWVKASGGMFAQMPSMPTSVPGFEGFGLASTGIQRSRQGSLGVEAQAGDLFTGTATAFLQRGRLSDLRTIFDVEPERGILEMRESRSYGIELLLKRDFSQRVHGWFSYTWSRSERLLGNYGPVVPSDWDQRHILSLLANVRLPRRWTLGGRVHYNTGRPYPVPDKQERVVDYYRLAPFLQLDVRAEKRFILDKLMLDAYLELGNVLVNEQEARLWRQDDGTLKHEGIRLVLPSLGVRAWF
jgi:hypothetical protein